jgi:uncharacterized damage-inducible protein DinB
LAWLIDDGAMTWTAPLIERTDAPYVGDERTILKGYLDWHRETLLYKCSGLTEAELKKASTEPSNLTLLGLVRHMTEVEHSWFTIRTLGRPESLIYCTEESPDGDFDDIEDADVEANIAAYLAECQASRDAVAALPLEHTFIHPRRQREMSLRWVYVHMIEEYARHNGHADLIRERIDGATGE